jgi:hypothetical protein
VRVYLDTNAASYLYHLPGPSKTLHEVRRALAERVTGGQIELIMSTSLIEEIAGISTGDLPRYVRTARFIFGLAETSFLLPVNERVRAEVASRGALSGAARFLPPARRRKVRSHMMRHGFAHDVADEVRVQTDDFKRDMEAKRQGIRPRLGADWSSKTAHWWNAALPQIDDWTLDYFRASRDLLGLPADEASWPSPRAIPTAWYLHAYYMARIALNVGQNRRIDGTDRYDGAHYASAVYADLMVTDDGRFIETYNNIPDRPFAIESSRAFAERLGVKPP